MKRRGSQQVSGSLVNYVISKYSSIKSLDALILESIGSGN
jgi:hypothetical protein